MDSLGVACRFGCSAARRILVPKKEKVKVLVAQSCPTLSDPLDTRLLCPWNSLGKNTGVGCHSFLQGIFPTQGLNPGLLHCRWILYQLSQQGSPGAASGKEPACWCKRCKRRQCDPWVRKSPLEKEMAVHSSIPAWRLPWTEESGGLQSAGS